MANSAQSSLATLDPGRSSRFSLATLEQVFDKWINIRAEPTFWPEDDENKDLPSLESLPGHDENTQQQEVVEGTRAIEDAPAAEPSGSGAVQEEQAVASDEAAVASDMAVVVRPADSLEQAAADLEHEAEDVQKMASKSVKELARRPPIFIISQAVICFLLWTIGAFITLPEDASFVTFMMARGGLESIFPDRTMLQAHGDLCQDYRAEVWRWISYQWTHSNFLHLSMNVLVMIIVGIPLEMFHGHLRTFLVFELSVMGGAINYFVVSMHSGLVGMSAGCYALLSMHAADLVINWAQDHWPKRKLAILLVLLAADITATQLASADDPTSGSAHLGGAITGLLVGVILARNKVVHRWERGLQAFIVFILLALIIFGVSWETQWPPRSIFDTQGGYCAVMQIWKQPWAEAKCAYCASQACVNKYSSKPFLSEPFTERGCTREGMSWYSE